MGDSSPVLFDPKAFLVLISFYFYQPFVLLWMGDGYFLPQLTIGLILINLFVQIT